jgi:catechol 2,3-dioxygenase-like lactoylglutathione lyase family enzyme
MIFDHIGLSTSDLARSRAFFCQALAPLGIGVVMEFPGTVGLGSDGRAQLWLGEHEGQTSPAHLAFVASDRMQVDAFHRAALAAGATDNGAPGIRAHYHADYYAAFVICPDGHNIEAVCRRAEG